jgi:(E)-4-hydroxy-3-methylbut-2-enyl-diphosphate synthase
VRGTNVAVVPEDEMVDALVEWAEFINEHGVERALAKADLTAAKAAADADRDALLQAHEGEDVNASEQRVDVIRKHASES